MRLFSILLLIVITEAGSFSLALAAAPGAKPMKFVHEKMTITFKPRKPDQMGSFYEARGFPRSMRDILTKQCFITVGIHNTSKQKIWSDLSSWKFSIDGEPIKREHRDYWKKKWQAMGIAQRHQSTFRWTLIPEALDYLPGEREGGNIVLPYTREKITLDATFATGENKQGEVISVHYDQIQCAEATQ